jgi:hypothetical protein
MKNEVIRRLISLAALLFLILNLVAACAQPNQSPSPAPPEPPPIQPPTQPPTTSETQPSEESPPVDVATDEEEWYTAEIFSGEVSQTTPAFHIYGIEWRITWTIDAEDPETAIFKLVIYQKDAPYAIWQTVSSSGSSSGEVNYFLFPEDKRDFFINVTAQNLRRWTIIVEDNAPGTNTSPVKITYIHYKGTVYPADPENGICYKRVEPDEYVVIKNLGDCYVDITGWVLKNANKLYPTFTFPSCTLLPGDIIRVYTDEVHPETGGYRLNYGTDYIMIERTGGLCFYWGLGDIWSNDKPDVAVLYDARGNEVSRKSYLLPMKINEANE